MNTAAEVKEIVRNAILARKAEGFTITPQVFYLTSLSKRCCAVGAVTCLSEEAYDKFAEFTGATEQDGVAISYAFWGDSSEEEINNCEYTRIGHELYLEFVK